MIPRRLNVIRRSGQTRVGNTTRALPVLPGNRCPSGCKGSPARLVSGRKLPREKGSRLFANPVYRAQGELNRSSKRSRNVDPVIEAVDLGGNVEKGVMPPGRIFVVFNRPISRLAAATFKLIGNAYILGQLELMSEAMTLAEKTGVGADNVRLRTER